jgi:hypothetical protein
MVMVDGTCIIDIGKTDEGFVFVICWWWWQIIMMGLRQYQLVPFLMTVLICGMLKKADGGEEKVIFAVNAGGEGHVDMNGVHYQKDPLKVGIASDYGKHLLSVGRVHPNDQVLYQTERYHHSTFGYDIPILEDGTYVMVLKFCEVYFNAPNMKVNNEMMMGKSGVVYSL